MKASGIFLTWLVVKDIKSAINFYTHTVGLILREYDERYGWAELSGTEGSILALAQENPELDIKAGFNAVATIAVDDIMKAREHFQNQGARLLGELVEIPGHVKIQTFLDLDGNHLQLVEKL